MTLDGVLVVDKPAGLTSHDVVAAARRALGERRIGHTGTLDPMATGVLPLAIGKATRLAQFLTASDKEYEAEIRFGVSTDTYDVTGRERSRSEASPSETSLRAALEAMRGSFRQAPPPFSAKKVGGRRAYDLARGDTPVQPDPVPVTLVDVRLLAFEPPTARLRLTCSAGFYVRSMAHDLGVQLGTGGCLAALRRLRSGEFAIDRAVPLDDLVRDPEGARRRILPPDQLLPEWPEVSVTAEGRQKVSHGQAVGPGDVLGPVPQAPWVRIRGPEGGLLAVGRPGSTSGFLHPSVVLI